MVNSQISDWVKEGLKKGYSKEQLKEMLKKKGYSEKEIEKALRKKNLILKIGIASIIIIVLISAYFLISYLDLRKSLKEEALAGNENCISTRMHQCLALITNNETWCGNDYQCNYFYILGKSARENNNAICDRMADNVEKMFCKAIVAKDSGICNELEGKEKEECMILFSRDESSCNKLEAESKGLCLMLSNWKEDNCRYFTEKC